MRKSNEQLLLEKLQQMDGKNGFAKYPILAINYKLLEAIWGNDYPADFYGKRVKAIHAEGVWLMERWPSPPNALKTNQFQGHWYFSESVKALKVEVHIYTNNREAKSKGLLGRMAQGLENFWERYVKRQ
jgi:hypothetical protein